MKRAIALATIAMALSTTSAVAGGWAVSVIESVLTDPVAGKTYRIGYTVLQHGVTPFVTANSAIELRSPSGEEYSFVGRAEGAPGHYVADVIFPTEGTWSWRVHQDWFQPQGLGTITVARASAQPADASARTTDASAIDVLLARVVLPILAGIVAVVFAVRMARLAVTRAV